MILVRCLKCAFGPLRLKFYLPDPNTAAALAFASTVTTVFSVVVCGSTYIVRVADGQYNDMLSVVF